MPRKTKHTVSRIAAAPAPAAAPAAAPTPAAAPAAAPTPAPAAPVYEKPSLVSTVLQGFALGTGQSLAFNMFRSDPVQTPVEKPVNYKEFVQCMKDNPYEDCKHYLNL